MLLGSIASRPSIYSVGNTTMINTKNYVSGNMILNDQFFTSSIAAFLLGNYRQVSQMIEELPSAIAALKSGKAAEDTHYHQHLESERQYLLSRRQESPEEEFVCEYIQRLLVHQKAK
jgi:hypothetical protein